MEQDNRRIVMAYGFITYLAGSGIVISYNPIHPNRKTMEDIVFIHTAFAFQAPKELWTWRKPSEIAYVIGLAPFGKAGAMRASRAMYAQNGEQRVRKSGQNLVLCPPLKRDYLAKEKEYQTSVARFSGDQGIGNDDVLNLLRRHFDTNAPKELWTEWRTAKTIVGIISKENASVTLWQRKASKAMRILNGDRTKRSMGKNLILCAPLKGVK